MNADFYPRPFVYSLQLFLPKIHFLYCLLSSMTFKIEFLLPLTGCRKVLGEMPEMVDA